MAFEDRIAEEKGAYMMFGEPFVEWRCAHSVQRPDRATPVQCAWQWWRDGFCRKHHPTLREKERAKTEAMVASRRKAAEDAKVRAAVREGLADVGEALLARAIKAGVVAEGSWTKAQLLAEVERMTFSESKDA